MKNKTPQPFLATIAIPLTLLAGTINPASAAIVFDFTASNSNVAPELLTVSSLVNGSPTDSSPTTLANAIAISGTLAGLTDNTQSFTMDFDAWLGAGSQSTVSGNDVTLGTANAVIAANNSQGIAPGNGLFAGNNGQSMTIVFDFTNFAPNTILRLTDFTASLSSGTSSSVLLVVDGVSSTSLSGLTGSGLSIDITDGDMLFIKSDAALSSSDKFRISSFTLEAVAVPEPSSLALLSLASLTLLRRRR